MEKTKSILILLFSLLATITMAQEYAIDKVQFESSTRGNRISMEVNSEELTFVKNGNEQKHKLKAEDWQQILSIIKTLSLQTIGQLESPTTKRFSDAAMHSKLTIVTTNEMFASQTFDNQKPPEPLNVLMERLIQLDKDYNKKENRMFK
jgi:hypothetical protein